MNETELVTLADDINLVNGNTPNGSIQIVNRMNDCKYEFTLKMQRTGTDVKNGQMRFTLASGFSMPNVTDSEGTDTLEQDPTTMEWVWTFGPLNTTPGVGPNRTLEFESNYSGDAGKTIITNATYLGTFADNSAFTSTTAQLIGQSTTKDGCEIPTKTPPEVTAVVTATGCSYHFIFTAKWKGSDISGGTLAFTLNNGFADPINIDLTGALDYTKPNGTWTFGNLDEETQTRSLAFDAIYTGLPGQNVFTAPITFNATYEEDGNTGEITVTPTGNTLTVQQCPATNPCCEACEMAPTDITVNPCNDYVDMPVAVAVDPKGKRLSVHLNLPPVCDTKDVNVGVFVTEVFNKGQANETEVPFAHKVIRRPATGTSGTCKNDRDCDCVDFIIDDDSACAGTRYFRVRTKAHYVDTAADAPWQCQCSTCTRP